MLSCLQMPGGIPDRANHNAGKLMMGWDIKRRGFCLAGSLAVALLSACTVGPDYVRPPVETAAQWLEAEDHRLGTTSVNDREWWKIFNDPTLNRLIDRAYRDNPGIQVAGVRVLEARAQLGIAIGDLYPQNQQLTSSLAKVHLSPGGKSPVEAAVEATRRRFRPIVMTSFAFILGVVPLLGASGAGAASQQAIGTVVFGDMLSSTLLAIPFVPVLYVMTQRLAAWTARRRDNSAID